MSQTSRITQDGQVMWRVLAKHGPLEKGMQTTSVFLPWEPQEQSERQKDVTLKDELPMLAGAQYATGKEWTPERMKRWSQSENNTHLWMWLVMEVKYDAVKNNTA